MVPRTDVKSSHSIANKACEAPVNPGLWKLLAAAGVLLVGLVVAMCVVDHDQHAGFAMTAAHQNGKL